LFCCLGTVATFAGVEDTYVLYEGFESGSVPANWTQEYSTAYQQLWVVESGTSTSYPKGAFAGDKYLILRNNTTQTQHFTTRLISPVFDLTQTPLPILVFSHVQGQRTGDVDILRIYYRTSTADNAKWVKLKEYSNNISAWRTDTLLLPAATKTYQLAFEGTDKFGRGIALDEIIVHATPTCENPNDISTDGLTANAATLRWNASLDADSFRVILSTQLLDNPDMATDVVCDKVVYDFQYDAAGLERDTRYYVYIMAYCPGGAIRDGVLQISAPRTLSFFPIANLSTKATKTTTVKSSIGRLAPV